MRKCVRCGSEMKEGYGLKIESIFAGLAPIRLSKNVGTLSDGLEKVKVAVCPECGELSIYIENSDKFK